MKHIAVSHVNAVASGNLFNLWALTLMHILWYPAQDCWLFLLNYNVNVLRFAYLLGSVWLVMSAVDWLVYSHQVDWCHLHWHATCASSAPHVQALPSLWAALLVLVVLVLATEKCRLGLIDTIVRCSVCRECKDCGSHYQFVQGKMGSGCGRTVRYSWACNRWVPNKHNNTTNKAWVLSTCGPF